MLLFARMCLALLQWTIGLSPSSDTDIPGEPSAEGRAPLLQGPENMSRRKQTTPNKVHWEQVLAGLEEQARQAMMKKDFPGAFGGQRPTIHQLQDQDSSSKIFRSSRSGMCLMRLLQSEAWEACIMKLKSQEKPLVPSTAAQKP
ncbi:ataxin-1-like isoform X2 [Carettochelys insculpta]|uniref:ataxin-1-like isoform X2 n=1 Tax=Carettochelys insculpta TaxID=44489 RepID=UPI003EBDBB67